MSNQITDTVTYTAKEITYDFTNGLDALKEILGVKSLHISFLAGDGSDRTYHRVTSEDSKPLAVIMKVSDSDNAKILKGTYEWCSISRLLNNEGLKAPKILGAIPSVNALVIEDFGDLMLESVVNKDPEASTKLYESALQTIISMIGIQHNSAEVWTTRSFDIEKLSYELHFFKTHYLSTLENIFKNPSEIQMFEKEVEDLSRYLAGYSKYFTHRDFHSRNIILASGEIGLIDFQDARLGPPSYDLVSLIYDPYVDLSFEQRESLRVKFIYSFEESIIAEEVKSTYKAMALQRILKAIGSFGYLTLTVKRGDYLKYVPKALQLLKDIKVEDERWPFITKTLLARLEAI